jgi:hypothetical protein
MRAFIASAIIALGALHPDITWANAAGAARQPAHQPPGTPVLARRGALKQSPVSPQLPNRGRTTAGLGHFTPLPSKASTAASPSRSAASLSGSNLSRRAPRSAVLGGPAAYAKQGTVIGGAAMAGMRTPRR